jgi:hypothetical protein
MKTMPPSWLSSHSPNKGKNLSVDPASKRVCSQVPLPTRLIKLPLADRQMIKCAQSSQHLRIMAAALGEHIAISLARLWGPITSAFSLR